MAIEAQLFDGTILEFPDDTERSVIDSTVKKLTLERQPKEKESPLRQVADIPLKFTEGVVSGVRMLSDAFGADNSISKSLRGVEDYVGSLLSAQAKNDQKEIARIMKEAEDKGVLEQIKAGFSALTVAPVDLMAQVFGTAIPTLAGGLAGAGLRVGAKALTGAALNVGAKTTGALTGAVMGAGTGKSAIYDAVVEELSKANLPKDVIEQAATKAQEYGGKNLDLILANTLLGGVAGSTGLEKALIPAMSKRITEKVAQRGALTRGAAAGFPEGGTEFLQGGTEQASKNIALQREGYDVPTMRGVYSAGTMEGLAGFGVGAAAGAMRRPTATEPVEPPIAEQPPVQLAPEPFTPTVIPQAYSTQEGIDRATGVNVEPAYTAADLLTPGAEGVREQAQRLAAQRDFDEQRQADIATKRAANPNLNPDGFTVGTGRASTTEEGRIAAQQAAFARADQEQGFTDQRQPMPVSPSQAVPYTAPAPVSIEERRKLADAQSEQLAQAQNEPFAFDRRRLEASASTVGGTGQVRGEPRAVLADPNPMVPRAARQRLAVMKEDAVANGEDPNGFVIVPHPTMGGRFAIEQRSMEQPYVAPPIETPTVSQAEAQRRIEASALAGSEQQRLAQDNPRQNMISRAMANIETRGGVASPYEAQLLREANMGRPYNSIDQGIAPESAPLGNESQRQQALEQEYQEQLAASRSGLAGPNLPIQRNVTPTVETPEAIEAERQARNKSDMAQQQRRLLELQQQRLTEQQNREEAGAAKAATPLETPSPDAVIGALRTPAPLRSAEESSLVSRAKSLMPAAEFNALQRAGEEDFNILQRAANAPATMSMQDKARLNVIREGRASLASEPQVATPEAKAMADDVRKKLLPVLKRFGLEKMGLRLVDSISNGAEGMYFKSVITLALDNENPMGVMRHEVIHALKELGAFTNGEWKVLTDMAKKKWINQFYSPELQAAYKKQFDQDGDTTQTFDEYMAEEAIAQAFRFYTETKPPSGIIANLMRRLNNMFAAIREFFMGNGVTNAEQLFLAKSIFSNIESGRMTAGRAGVQPRTTPAYALKNDLTTKEGIIEDGIKRYAEALKRHRIGQTDTRGIIPQIKINALDKIHDGIRARLEATGLSKSEADDLVWKKVLPEARGSVYYPDSKKYSLSEEKTYKLDIDREVRKTARSAVFTEAETKSVEDDAVRLNLSPAQTAEILSTIKKQKKQFPATQGWDNLTVIGIDQKLDDLGNPIAGTEFPKYEPITYGYGTPPDKTKAPSKIDQVWMDKVADAFTKQILGIYKRSAKGDKNAQSIIAHKSWYKGVAKSLRQDYGAFGDILADLLGATSPNTPVDTNWKFSIDVLKRFARGDFDTEMKAFTQYLDTGGVPSKYPAAQKIRQISGKLYGMNSTNAMLGLADMWRAIVPGQAPKARNFALNLIGQSDMATIDVWAARMLRRVANNVSKDSFKRIPPPAEKGVTGMWNASASKVTGEFGFGAAVMDKVSKDLKAKGIDIAPPDLQAIAWFAEKELWGNKGWTSKVGEGGSFEENIQNSPVERYVAAHSVQEGDTPPSENVVNFAKKVLLNALGRDKSVVTFRSKETKGLYGGTVEASFDTEWVAQQGKFDPAQIVSILASTSKEQNQYDFFVSKVLAPNEDSLNARPGVEIYFKDQKALQDALPLLKKFTSKGQDGFTLAVDPRATDGSDKYIGVRLQYVPEISMRWDNDLRKKFLKPDEISRVLAGKRKILGEIVSEVARQEGVAHAEMLRYDTLVVGKENYNDYIGTRDSAGNQKPRRIWFGGDIRQHVEAAAKRYSDAERAERGAVGGASDQQESGGKFSLRPEQLALRPSDSGGSGITFNNRKEDAVSYAGSHYGKTKTNILSGGYYGTGLKGAEAKRLAQAKDSRIGKRIYFYIPRANGTMPMRESGVGNHVYTQKFDNILGPGKTMSELYKKAQGDSNAFESFVIDNGYDGYAVPDYGMMVVLNNDIEAKYEGTVGEVHYGKTEPEKGARFSRALGALEPATSLVPDTSLNNTGNLGIMPETRDIEPLPIRFAVGMVDPVYAHKGYGANKMIDRMNKDSSRKPPVVTKELLEDLVRQVERVAQSYTRLYKEQGKFIAYNPITTESLILSKMGDHYSVVSVYKQNNMGKYGNVAWTGKTPTEFKRYLTAEEPQKGIPVKAGASGVIRQPVATTFKQRKVMSPAAIQEMADDLAKTKLQGKASLRTPPALLKQTLTDSFKRWFGKSAIVDMNGDPKVMYHGTARDITEFRGKQAGAIFVTPKPSFAEEFTDSSENFMMKELFNGMSEKEKVAILNKALKLAKKNKLSKKEIDYVQGYIKDSADSTFGLIPSAIEEEIFQLLKDSFPSRANILPVFVRAEKPFDYENPDHINRIVVKSRQINGDDQYRDGSFVAQIQDYIEAGNWEEIENKLVQDAIKAAGFDGFYIKENGVKNLAVYDPNQLKSAIGNTGAFSPESKDIRYSLTNNVPPAVHTKLVPNQSAGQQVTAAATNAIKAVREDGYFTKLRDGIVDDTSTLGNTLANQGMSQFAKNKLRADMLKHTQSNSINIMTVGLQSGVPVLNTDGSIIIKRTESNIARSLILADKLDSNPYVKASKLKGGRGFVAEVARALRGADIKEEDAAMNAEGQKKINDADAMEASLNAAVKAGGLTASAIASEKGKIDKLRKEGKELAGKNREKQVDDAQIQWAEAQLKNVPELKEIFGIWKDVNDALTDLSEDTGIISKEQAQKYRDKKFYVPLFKAREDLAESFFHGSSAKNVAKNYKLEGADIDRNIWENIQKQYAMTIAVAYENQTRKTAIEQLQGFGLAKTVDNPNDPNINLRYKEDGKIVHAIAENPNDIAAFQMMNYELNSVMKFISGTTKVLRFGALVNPMFWFKQLIRDPIHASLTNNQIVTPFHSAVAFAKILNNSSASAKILAERGVIGAVDSTVDLNEYLGQLGKEKKTPQMLSSLMHKVMRMHESSDAATRVAIFESAKKEALKKGMNEEEAINFAVFRARESINFGVKGNSQTLNVLRHSIPFFQAAITSLDTVYRAATGYGLPPAERRKAQLTFAKRAAVMGLMSTMYAMMYTDDDEYKDLPDYVKDGNWLFPTTTPDGRKTFVKIPVPFEIGFLFKTLPEAGWRWYSGTSTGKEVAKSVKDGLIHNIPGGGTIVPQAFKPAFEVIVNHSLFTGNPIEGMSDQGLPVAERGRNASEFAKATSKAGLDSMGLSPAKIDALIKGYFAELGGTFLAVTSDLIGTDKPTKNIESYPFAKSFTTDPKVSKAVSDFYTLEHNAKEMTNMFAKLKKEGLFDTAREYLADDDKKKQMLAAPVFRKIGEQLGQIKTEIKRVENREGMDADEKRTRINELQKLLAQTAKKGYEVAERAGIAR